VKSQKARGFSSPQFLCLFISPMALKLIIYAPFMLFILLLFDVFPFQRKRQPFLIRLVCVAFNAYNIHETENETQFQGFGSWKLHVSENGAFEKLDLLTPASV
jgi:hypothetical protein